MSTKIKSLYSFIAATTVLDVKTPFGRALVDQVHPYACQNLRKGDAEFDRLYKQVEQENPVHVLGTGMATSSEGFGLAFEQWLKSHGIELADAGRKKKIAIFAGNAQDPRNGKSFGWCVFIYFDLEG